MAQAGSALSSVPGMQEDFIKMTEKKKKKPICVLTVLENSFT